MDIDIVFATHNNEGWVGISIHSVYIADNLSNEIVKKNVRNKIIIIISKSR